MSPLLWPVQMLLLMFAAHLAWYLRLEIEARRSRIVADLAKFLMPPAKAAATSGEHIV